MRRPPRWALVVIILAAAGAVLFAGLSLWDGGKDLTIRSAPAEWAVEPGKSAEVALVLHNRGARAIDAEVAVEPRGYLRIGGEYLFHSSTDAGWLSASPQRHSVSVPAGGEAAVRFTISADARTAPVRGGEIGFVVEWSEPGGRERLERNVRVHVLDRNVTPDVLALVAIAGAGAAIGGLFFGLRRVDWQALLGAIFAPLYSRIHRSEALESERRRRIMTIVEDEPGIHFAELARRTALPNGALYHHLGILQQNGLVTSHKERGRRVYAPSAAPARPSEAITPAERRLLDLLPPEGITASELADHLGITRQGVYYHAQKLAERGLLRREDAHGTLLYFRA